MQDRYFAAYSIANSVVRIGKIIIIASLILGVVAGVFSYFDDFFYVAGSMIIGLGIAATGCMFGFLMTALGQILQALLDTAVNTSPLLSIEQKSEVMGI